MRGTADSKKPARLPVFIGDVLALGLRVRLLQ